MNPESWSTVAAVQLNSGADVAANLRAAVQAIECAAGQGAQLVVLPENFAFMGAHERDKLAVAEPPGDGPLQQWLAGMARRLGLWIVAGTLPMKAPADPAGRVHAASLVVADDGRVVARYDKIHLFDVDLDNGERYRESASIAPGVPRPGVADTPVGRVGLSVCYDLRFAELYAGLAQADADGLCVPSAFTERTTEAHWMPLLRARAIENQCWVVAPNQCGDHPGGRRTGGRSMIIDAWGRVLAEAGPGEPATLVARIDREEQQRLRRQFPVRRHRRLGPAVSVPEST